MRYDDFAALDEALADLPREDELAVVFSTGGDRTFLAGHDVEEFGAHGPEAAAEHTEIYMSTLASVYECPVPLIAAVDGPAVGAGAILASLCDMRVAAPDAGFAITEINVGIIGGLGPLKRLLPDGVARRLAYTGEELPAERAHELGMVEELAAEPVAAATDLADTIAAQSPDAVRAAKASAIEGQPDWPLTDYRRERGYIDDLREGDNAAEAARAFLEDREPDFEY
jgi:enoyl-CoA hydratase